MATQVAATSASSAFSRGKATGDRRWALYASYFFLMIFIVFFLFPPYYMLITSLKTDQEISSLAGNPWIINGKVTLITTPISCSTPRSRPTSRTR